MKKIFAISFLSVFAVVGVARANYYDGYYASGTDADKNYNLASVNYVKGSYGEAVKEAKGLVIKSDKETSVAGWSSSLGFAGSDEKAPTIKYMENSIATAVDGKVNVSQGAANKNAIMITNAAGNVIPALVGDCANTTNKCALVTGVDTSGNLVLQWEVIARNVPQPSAGE
ncbi:MAG: hypothetical protein IKB49_04385 [Alphaproteobacteria bacterium]|nr:hypothetical protein [Alphaproteobacteria bacterium]